MPDTALENGIATLTRRYVEADAEQILITFSAGVAQLDDGESGEQAIARAELLHVSSHERTACHAMFETFWGMRNETGPK